VIYNFDRIRHDYVDACRREGIEPCRLIRPAWYPPRRPVVHGRPRVGPVPLRLVRGTERPAAEAASLPPDVFAAVVDALATALVADVRADGRDG
jgi:hypothetical protein